MTKQYDLSKLASWNIFPVRREGFGVIGWETPDGYVREDDDRKAGQFPALGRYFDSDEWASRDENLFEGNPQ